ncbi:BON domain-containing protein [Urbifossiella limnaea]|uniref:BON domain protein n=1 Tax=Urbifossiella limnaea TaxID=2528023 RepID=A0A517XYX9_9BACT|nr:BON domain-containing protein [Urbifossiella limnaea]QDU22701.1 BON domain protein [Urbifossiella limnaea]
MKVRALFSLAAAAGISAGTAGAQSANPNQPLADAVKARVGALPSVGGADLSVLTQGGTVRVLGTAVSAVQKDAVIAAVRGTPGVTLVEDGIVVRGTAVTPVQFPAPGAAPVAPPVPPAHLGGGNPVVEPVPLGVPGSITPDLQAPPLPPYAWPTYAPHNNVSRVGYPEAYPYNAFPYIGPYYPFPKVPLGWRKVTLEWEDGHWYLGRNSAPHDYWRVRFW